MTKNEKTYKFPRWLVKQMILYLPYLIVFFSSIALMTVELVAGRITGSHLGSSFYTWAAIILVILAGNGLGNYLGGKLADRGSSFQALAKILTLAAISLIFSLLLNRILAFTYNPFKILNWPARILGSIFIVFILPPIFLGIVTPISAKLVMACSAKHGIIIGNIYAWSTIGSICGVFLSSFYLIAALPSTGILLLIALILILTAVLLQVISKRKSVTAFLPVTELIPPADAAAGKSAVLPETVSWGYPSRLVIFFSSGCLMMIELMYARLLSRYYGSSIYSWTSIIGVVLSGMAIGYFIGGRLAERPKPDKYLGRFLGASSLFTLTILLIVNYLWVSTLLDKLSLPWQVFLTTLSALLAPTVTLGAISPLLYKLAFGNNRNTGFTIGSIGAWGIAGSIAGTLTAGFWLISILGVFKSVLIIVVGLAVVSWWFSANRWISAAWLLISAFIFWAAGSGPELIPFQAAGYLQKLGLRPVTANLIFAADSKYQYVKVYQGPQNRRREIRALVLDSLIHGYVDLHDPADLRYEYEHIYANLTRRYAVGKNKIKAFFIGAGSYTFPRWVLHQWPKSRIDVAEIDPVVVAANYRALGLPINTPIHTFIGDARNIIGSLPPDAKYDFIYGDAFNDFSVPWHLTTLEFTKTIKNHLNPDGAYLLNVIDNYDNGLMVGASYLTLKQVFRNVYVFCTNPLRIQNLRDTFILVASDKPIDTGEWNPDFADPDLGVLLTAKNLAYLAKRCGGLVLTDDFAPVENLLAPVVGRRKVK